MVFLSNISDKNYSNLKNFYDRVATISLIILYLRSKLNHSHVYKKKIKKFDFNLEFTFLYHIRYEWANK